MKKFLLFLTLFLSAVGIATANEKTISSTFTDQNLSVNDSELGWTANKAASYSLSVIDPSSGEITINNSDLPNSGTLTTHNVNGVTLEFIKNGSSNDAAGGSSYFKLYAKNILNISISEAFVITKIVFTGTSGYINAKKIASNSNNGTVSASGTTAIWALNDKATATNTVSIINNDGAQARISKIVVYYEAYSSKEPAGLAYTPTEVTLAQGEALTQPTFANPNELTVSYSSDNAEVATVNATTGEIALAGGLGTAVITATTEGDATHKAGTATFTITVAKQYIWSDTKAVLVTKASPLQPGDVIIIANPTEGYIMTNAAVNSSSTYFTAATITDLNTIPSNAMLLQYVEYETGKYALRTLNHAGSSQGYITIHSSASSTTKTGKGYVRTTAENNVIDVNISIASETSKATISFGTNADIFIKLNAISGLNPPRFAGYTASSTSQKDVYIYRLEGSTTISSEDADCNASVENGNTTLKANSYFYTNSDATKFVVKMNGVAIDATVEKADDLVSVDMVGLPYVPGAVFTISPVVGGEELHPVTLGITIPTLPVVDFGAVTLKLYFDKDTYGSEKTCNLDAWAYLPVVLKDAARDEVLAADDARRNLALTFKEFANSVADTEIWGWYDENKDQVQWCKYDYLTNVPVEAGTAKIGETELATLSANPVNLTFTPVYSFNVANKFASLIPSATPGSLSAPARAPEGFTVQNVELTALPVSQTWSDTPDVSGVESVVVEGVDGAVEYYNMQGVRVEGELAPGMYIRRQGRSVSKVQIR